MEYTSQYYIDPYNLATIQEYQSKVLPKILSTVSNAAYRDKILRYIL